MATARPLRLLLIGPPGGGKGTIGHYLSKDFGCSLLSTGDLLRAQIAAGTPAGLAAQQLIAKGVLVPDATMLALLREALATAPPSWILDGFPRTLDQAKALLPLLQDLRQPLHAVFELAVPREVRGSERCRGGGKGRGRGSLSRVPTGYCFARVGPNGSSRERARVQ